MTKSKIGGQSRGHGYWGKGDLSNIKRGWLGGGEGFDFCSYWGFNLGFGAPVSGQAL